jgi:hypothetical protein
MTRLTDEQLDEAIKHCTGLSMALDGIHWPMMLIALKELQALRAKPTPTPDQWKQIREALKEYNGQGEWVSTSAAEEALAIMDEIERTQ